MFAVIKEAARKVYEIIDQHLDPKEFTVLLPNYANSIRVTGLLNPVETTMWIRIEPFRNLGIAMNLNDIALEERLRGKGILTGMVQRVIDAGIVNVFVVSSASTREIHEWCQKRGMEYDEMSLTYHEITKSVSQEDD